jgi:hypothetical protein
MPIRHRKCGIRIAPNWDINNNKLLINIYFARYKIRYKWWKPIHILRYGSWGNTHVCKKLPMRNTLHAHAHAHAHTHSLTHWLTHARTPTHHMIVLSDPFNRLPVGCSALNFPCVWVGCCFVFSDVPNFFSFMEVHDPLVSTYYC